MKVRVPVMVQDQWTAHMKGMVPIEDVTIEEDFFLDGPVTRRVAILDFEPQTGGLRPGARFLPPPSPREAGTYDLDPTFEDDRFNQVSAFGAVLRTIQMFEEKDTLGRPVTWAFGAPQLLVIPRAGEWANAFYERASHSLQFFFFESLVEPGRTIYTNLSHDILSHETGHAVLDGIAPDLFDAITPQSLALHEAIADLTALVMAFRSRTLRKSVLDQTRGSIENSNAFSAIADEFGADRDPRGHAGYLRSLKNDLSLDSKSPNFLDSWKPHDLCQVLTGGLYELVVRLHDHWKKRFAVEDRRPEFEVSGKALFAAGEQFKRMVFRALDYMPPGEVSFADYARAIIAADQASHPDQEEDREWIREEFVRRGIVGNRKELEVEREYSSLDERLKEQDLATLAEVDYAAYRFAERNREELGMPDGVPFTVRPRLDVTKAYRHRDGVREVRELLFKVTWRREIPSGLEEPYPPAVRIALGTTLAVDWSTKKVRARLTARHGGADEEGARHLLRHLADEGLLRIGDRARGPDGKPLRSYVFAESAGGALRVRGTAARFLIYGREAYG